MLMLLAIENIPFVYTTVKERSKSTLQIAFDIVEDFLLNLYGHPDVVEFKTVTILVNDRMKNKGFTDDDIAYVKRHLREKIEPYQLKHFTFVNVDKQKLVIFPVSFKTEDVLVRPMLKIKSRKLSGNSRLPTEIFRMLRLLFGSSCKKWKIKCLGHHKRAT